MQRVYPVFRITDYEKSEAFYVNSLGFRIDREHRFESHFPVFRRLSRHRCPYHTTDADWLSVLNPSH